MVCEYNEDSGFIRYNANTSTNNPANQNTRNIIINEIDADTPGSDIAEFIELYDGGTGNTELDYLAIVFFNGSNDESYKCFSLDGNSTDSNGYFLFGNSGVAGCDLALPNSSLQNGADAVVLYVADEADFPTGTPVTTTNIVDAVVYDTDDADDTGLLTLLNAGQPQVDEDGRGNKDIHSLQRIPNGSGGERNTSSYVVEIPTPGEQNIALPIITIEGNSTLINNKASSPNSGNHTAFPNVAVNGGESTREYTIKNGGLGALNITGSLITGTNNVDFYISVSPSQTIASGSSSTFTVTFNPAGQGLRSATVNIFNNDVGSTPYEFDVSGEGLTPEIVVSGQGIDIPNGDITPDTADDTDFGSQLIQSGTISKTFTIQNAGTGLLNLGANAVSLSGGDLSDFNVSTQPATTVAVSGLTTFTVEFDPSASGLRKTTVNIANDDSDKNPYDFVIQGMGTDPEINVLGNNLDIANGNLIPRTDDYTDFGSQLIQSGTISKTFTIQNTGTGLLTLGTNAVSLSGSDASDFSIKIQPALSVTVNGSTTFTVEFGPTATGLRKTTVNIANDDGDENPYDFIIQGTGIDIYAPTIQANSVIFSNIHAAKFSLSWTRGNGNNCAVFVAEGSSGFASPADDILYNADPIFRSGEKIGSSGWYCVYNGTSTTADVGKLQPNTTYRLMVCEYNEDSGFIRYNANTSTNNPANQNTRNIIINEIDADTPGSDIAEFIELYDGGTGNTELDYLTIVLFNGSNDESYKCFSLDGNSTDSNGYFLFGNSGVAGCDLALPNSSLQNGADAVVLYVADEADFPTGTPVTTTNIVDAVVYDTDDADDPGLLTLLNAGQPQVDEDGRGNKDIHSLQRIPNGSGGERNTSSYVVEIPTPGEQNIALPIITIEGNSTLINDEASSPNTSDHTAFPNVAVNGGESTREYIIKNGGLGALNITGYFNNRY